MDNDFKICPYCSEPIRSSAIKCRFCGEWLDAPPIESKAEDGGSRHAPPISFFEQFAPEESLVSIPGRLAGDGHDDSANNANVESSGDPENESVHAPASDESTNSADVGTRTLEQSTISIDSGRKRRRGYFVKHWRGELSLPVSYWVNGVLLGVFVALPMSLLIESTDQFDNVDLRIITGLVLGLLILTVCLGVWQIVGIFRAASRHNGTFWRVVVQVVMVFWILRLAYVTFFVNGPPMLEYAKILVGDPAIPRCMIRILGNQTELEISGGLPAGSAARFREDLAHYPKVVVIHVNSSGGRIHEAEQIARIVRDRQLITYTSDECLSAATLILMAGRERVVAAGAKVGFHRGQFPGLTAQQGLAMDRRMRDLMTSAGVDDEFVSRVLRTPSESMWYPTIEEMINSGFATSESLGDRFAASGREYRITSDDELQRSLESIPCFATLKKIEPETFSTMLSDFSKAVRSGKTEGEAIATVASAVGAVLEKYFPFASDRALLDLQGFWIDVLRRYKDKNSDACVSFFSGAGLNPKRAFPDWDDKQALVVMDQVFRSGASRSPVAIDHDAAEKDLAGIGKHLVDKYGLDAALLQDSSKWMKNSRTICDILLEMYEDIARLPGPRSANLLRHLLTSTKELPEKKNT